MTIEQLEQANEIKNKIDKLKEFQTVLNAGIISVVAYELNKSSDKVEPKISHLDFNDSEKISDMVRGYVSKKITELEKQLEEI